MNPIKAYTHWLHTQWPAGKPETLPVVSGDGSTNVDGLYVVGDLSGVPLLKLSVNAGVKVVRKLAEGDLGSRQQAAGNRQEADEGEGGEVLDIAIVGGGTAGFAAAKEAEAKGLRYLVFESSEPFSTIVNFPKEKPIYKYPTEMETEGEIKFHEKSDIKEGLLEDLREQTVKEGLKWVHGRVSHVEKKGDAFEVVVPDKVEKPEGADLNGTGWAEGKERVKARRVVVAIGRSGNYRKLDIPGEDKDGKVFNRLHDPKDYCGQKIVVVGGGDSAMEAAIALAKCGADVTLSYRKDEFNRPKPENREMLLALSENPKAEARIESPDDVRQATSFDAIDEKPEGSVELIMSSNLTEIRDDEVDIETEDGETKTVRERQRVYDDREGAAAGVFPQERGDDPGREELHLVVDAHRIRGGVFLVVPLEGPEQGAVQRGGLDAAGVAGVPPRGLGAGVAGVARRVVHEHDPPGGAALERGPVTKLLLHVGVFADRGDLRVAADQATQDAVREVADGDAGDDPGGAAVYSCRSSCCLG